MRERIRYFYGQNRYVELVEPATVFDDPDFAELFGGIAAIRKYREDFRSTIVGGHVGLLEIFQRATSDPVIASMKVLPAIEGLPEAGKVQTRRAFEELGISEAAHIGDVPKAAIDALAGALERHAL
ncbi:MAG: hypothetical protein ACI81L_000602 [Verrucomicrobiales bacterium]